MRHTDMDLFKIDKLIKANNASEFVIASCNNQSQTPYYIAYELVFTKIEIRANENKIIFKDGKHRFEIRGIKQIISRSVSDNYGWVIDLICNDYGDNSKEYKFTVLINDVSLFPKQKIKRGK